MASRPLLVPHKRPLISKTNIKDLDKSTRQVLNPSAVAAETRMKPVLSADDNQVPSPENSRSTRVELSFGMPPQQFLDPPAWEAMLKKHKETQAIKESTGVGHKDEDFETADQRLRREKREAEYGSMAIRGRSSLLRGRGKRGKGKGRGRIH